MVDRADPQLLAKIRSTGHDPGTYADDEDIRIALMALGHNPGGQIDPGDINYLTANTPTRQAITFNDGNMFTPTVDTEANTFTVENRGGTTVASGSLTQGSGAGQTNVGSATDFDEDAFAILYRLLEDYDLTELDGWLRDALINNWSEDRIRAELPNQQAFKDRFPGLEIRRQEGRPMISPNEYIRLELAFEEMLRMANMPEGFYDSHEDFAELIGKNVTVSGLAQRINQGYLAVAQAPAEVRQIFGEYFGVNGDSALAAYVLDPEREEAKILEAVAAAEVGGTARRFGLEIGFNKADRIQRLGLSAQQVGAGFGQVNRQKPLFRETIAEKQDFTAEGVGTNAVFGLDPNAEDKLRRRLESRISRFGGSSGGAAFGQTGVTGLGSANTL